MASETTAPIETLPNEVLARIATCLTRFRDIGAFACTSLRFRALLEPLYSPTTKFMHACARGDVDLARTLLDDEHVDPTAQRNLALRSSLEFGHVAIVRLLLDDGYVDPVAIDDDTITRACANKHWLALDMIIGPEPNRKSARRERSEHRLSGRFAEWRLNAKQRVHDASRRSVRAESLLFLSRLFLAPLSCLLLLPLLPTDWTWLRSNGFLVSFVALPILYDLRRIAVPSIAQAYKLARGVSFLAAARALWDFGGLLTEDPEQ
jgi:hypothetical protein